MKTITNYFCVAFFLFSSLTFAQVGIGTTTPTESLDVDGNIKFSGAIMPNNDPGLAGQILTSSGSGSSPTWGAAMLNPSQTTGMGKFFSGLFDITTQYLDLTLTDPNCVPSSTCTITWVGPLPTGVNYGDLVTTVEAQNGQWIFHIANNTGYGFVNMQFSYFAFY